MILQAILVVCVIVFVLVMKFIDPITDRFELWYLAKKRRKGYHLTFWGPR